MTIVIAKTKIRGTDRDHPTFAPPPGCPGVTSRTRCTSLTSS